VVFQESHIFNNNHLWTSHIDNMLPVILCTDKIVYSSKLHQHSEFVT